VRITFIWSILAILVLCGCGACGDDGRAQSSPSPIRIPPASTAETQTAATPATADFQDPTAENIQRVREIYQELPKPLPEGNDYRIEYKDSPSAVAGMFNVVVVDPATMEAFVQAAEESYEWFRQSGYEPCQPPLDGLITVTATQFPQAEGPPPPGFVSWEPCSSK